MVVGTVYFGRGFDLAVAFGQILEVQKMALVLMQMKVAFEAFVPSGETEVLRSLAVCRSCLVVPGCGVAGQDHNWKTEDNCQEEIDQEASGQGVVG